jgi:uncharacterized protein YciI
MNAKTELMTVPRFCHLTPACGRVFPGRKQDIEMALIPENAHLFVVDLHYQVPLAEVEPQIEPHKAFLEDHYAAGRFLVSGAKVPRTGGVIIAVAETKADVETIIREDPFHQHGIARYTITEFLPSSTAEGLR